MRLRVVAGNGRATQHQPLFQNQNASRKKMSRTCQRKKTDTMHNASIRPCTDCNSHSLRKVMSPSIRTIKSLALKNSRQRVDPTRNLCHCWPNLFTSAWVPSHSLQSRKQCPRQFRWGINPKKISLVSRLKQITSAGYNTNASYLSIPKNL